MTNENQQAIIEAGDEPILVVAGPGAGKTHVLEQRVRRLLSTRSGSHFRVLAITFTNVAAANLKHRVEDLESDRLEIGTFHAFAARILQLHGSHIGLSPDFSIISSLDDRVAIATEAIGRLPDSLGASDVEAILPLIARRYERGLFTNPESALARDRFSQDAVTSAANAYRDVSVERAQLDFSLLVYVALELLSRFPAISRLLRKIYRYVCVDEFQDTNEAQFQLISALTANESAGLLFLADQDQVIYQWNGASPRRLREAVELFGMNVMLLPTSYRCPPVVLEAANRLIAHNKARFVAPQFQSSDVRHGSVTVHAFGSESEEAHWIVSQLSQEENRDSVVVLARNRSIVERIARVAQDTGVRAAIPVTRYEFESAPLSMLHSMLRLANTSDSIKAINRLCGAFFQMTGRQVDPKELRSRAVADEENPLTVFFSLLMPIAATAEFKQLGEVVTNELVEHRYFRNVSTHFFKWVDRIGSKTDWARSAYLASYDDERAVWEEFERLHRGLVSENVALSEFLRALDLASKAPVEQDVIRLLTVHGAKGLEFERVYIAGASDGQFPAFQAVKLGASSDAMEEERRSFFVAITRSSDEVLISYSSIVRGFVSEPSRFLREMKVL